MYPRYNLSTSQLLGLMAGGAAIVFGFLAWASWKERGRLPPLQTYHCPPSFVEVSRDEFNRQMKTVWCWSSQLYANVTIFNDYRLRTIAYQTNALLEPGGESRYFLER